MISLNELTNLANTCTCGNHHNDILIDEIVISEDALVKAVKYIEKSKFKKVVLIADQNTFEVAGQRVSELLSDRKIDYCTTLIRANKQGDVIADEVALIEAMLGIPQDADSIIAVGAGTIHDIARFASFKMAKPFISIPTAPSVDGFNSMGAPVVIKGIKTTYQMQSPIAVFADINILQKAPKQMIAAGFGDMIGKYTSLADWKFSHLIGKEPYCTLSAQLTKEALNKSVNALKEIVNGEKEGIKILIESLIQSGLAMLLVGYSSPASGGEHHLSHFWEMDFIKEKKPQVLHGAKVGVSTQIILDLYKNNVLDLIGNQDQLKNFSTAEAKVILDKQHEIITIVELLPKPKEIANMLSMLEGPVTPCDIGIEPALVQDSLNKAHELRNRYTLLKFWNEHIGEHQYV
ncbi:glycerol-1-phosphate dehydrogenase [NAD(P)+] [Metabacillus crassostreae]|uniref:sn-glycerol-1-phosphate dehydrogenase n=1 Tax=Metabacillus crassostreae TaxID=929098 RepID=UPI00195DFEA8|nr:sn-glycerol-1-phosphate dehydrogenase [Metabacillus crassostreae]MBM7603847.1 glycerol-1-phosphate dehydrogenase [NAD(P)+] [Metabacillus crassostreae]